MADVYVRIDADQKSILSIYINKSESVFVFVFVKNSDKRVLNCGKYDFVWDYDVLSLFDIIIIIILNP